MTNKNIRNELDEQNKQIQGNVSNISDDVWFVCDMERTINIGTVVIYHDFRNFIYKETR